MELSKLKNLLGFQAGHMVFEDATRALAVKRNENEVMPQTILLDEKGTKFIVLNGRKHQIIEHNVGEIKKSDPAHNVIKVYGRKKPENKLELASSKDMFLTPRMLVGKGSIFVVETVKNDRTILNLVPPPEITDSGQIKHKQPDVQKVQKSSDKTPQLKRRIIIDKPLYKLDNKFKTPIIKFIPGGSNTTNSGIPPVPDYQPVIIKQFGNPDPKVRISTNVELIYPHKSQPGESVLKSKLNNSEIKNLVTTSTNTEKSHIDKEVQTRPYNIWETLLDYNKSDIIIGNNVNMGTGPKVIPYSYNDSTKVQFYKDLQNCLKWDSGNLPIHKAIVQRNLAAVKSQCVVMKVRNAGVNIVNSNNYTPLHLSIIHNVSIEIVQVLLHYKADMSVLDPDGNNVLHLAVQNSREDLLKLFLDNLADSKIDIDQYNYEGFTPLMCCAFLSEKFEMAKLLLKMGVEMNARDQKSGRTTIFHAAENHNQPLVSLLLEYGADTRIRNFFGTSAHDAVFELEDLPKDIKYSILGNVGYTKTKQKRKNIPEEVKSQPDDSSKRRKFDVVSTYRKIAPKSELVVKVDQV